MNKKEVITQENVKTMGEIIAVSCARRYCTNYYFEKAKNYTMVYWEISFSFKHGKVH